jgi:glycosyltransferase involved in cell wall biosynthesis
MLEQEIPRIAIISSHPIQYNAPLFKLLSERKQVSIKVFYTWGDASKEKVFDPGFGSFREWDIPLLEGYEYEFVPNSSKNPGSSNFSGIQNPSLISSIINYHPNAILVYGWKFSSHLAVLRHFKNKIPLWFRGDSNLLDETESNFFKKIVRKTVLKWVYSHIDKALFVGTANKDYYLEYQVPETKLKLVPHSIDNDRFGHDDENFEAEANKLREKLGIKTSDFIFLFCGKLESKKDPILLISAFKQMQNQTALLVFVGSGHLESELKELAGNDSRIFFLGFQNQTQMPVIYRLANVMVLPSKGPGETWGLSINEAMASGRPVIASDKCGATNDLINALTGWSFASGDLASLSGIMQSCLAKPLDCVEKGHSAKSFISQFSCLQAALKIEEIAKEIKI